MITDKCAEDKSDKDVAQGLDLLHSSADWCQKSTMFDSYALLKFNKFKSASCNVSVHVNAWASWECEKMPLDLKSTAVFSGIQSLRKLGLIVSVWSQC